MNAGLAVKDVPNYRAGLRGEQFGAAFVQRKLE